MNPIRLTFSGVAALSVLNAFGAKPSIQTETKKPNIIFILTDDLGWGDLGFQFQNQRFKTNDRSEPAVKTPNMDVFAAKGVQLPNQYCSAPVSAPSRASLFLGQHQGHANVRDNQFDKALQDNYTIASVLKAAGYKTAIFGKWGLQGLGTKQSDAELDDDHSAWVAHPLNRGFDYFFGYMRHKDGHEHYPKEGIYDGKKEVYENHTNVADKLDKCYTGDLWTAAAKHWIVEQTKNQKAGNPFFVFLSFDTPHAVIELPTQKYPSGGGLTGGLQWLGQPGHMINTASGVVDSWIHPDYANQTYDNDKNPSTPEVPWPNVYKRYATSTRRIDDAVGDLLKLLKDLKIDKNTMLVFTSDNGPSRESYLTEDFEPNFFNNFGPFDGIKRDALEGGVRVSALALWPGHFPAGRVVQTPSSHYDWLPTLAQVAGIPAPAVADGVSLLPSLTGKGKQRESLVYVEYNLKGKTPNYDEFLPKHRDRVRNQMQMIRLGNHVGVRYDIQSNADDFEIFDVTNDPQQTHNLATNMGMEALQQQMKDKVLQSRRPNDSAKRPYDNELVPATHVQKVTQGVEWKAFNEKSPWIPETSNLTPSEMGTTDAPNLFSIKNLEVQTLLKNNAFLFSGYIQVPEDGEYTFYIKCSNKAFLRIHDAAVIDADYGYTAGDEVKGSIPLKAGLHPFRMYFRTKDGTNPSLNFQWSGTKIEKQTVPSNVFMRDLK